ncbi:hypothetical protein OG562_23155 [Streptomyces sp. NBC_01275]|uniref:hypothetical protein n=1 Tax=Streptomyces sp. NBC_01275 TaxID=2903807 RepID=UPI00224F94FB|nr:hypothetical protein [Streptomyces sp. NBC_01275]MCX4763812.1 hypothetical protein [Streptomyces sp. NBC_01275]
MSNANGVGMTAWVSLAVSAVGPAGDRPYDVWLAEVERIAVDLWLMSAPGGSTARLAEALSTCTPVTGVLAQAHVDGGRAGARLVVRVPGADGGPGQEYTFHTEELTGRRARDVLERAQSLIGAGVRLLLSPGEAGAQRVLHISDSGEREPGAVLAPATHSSARAPQQPVAAPVHEHQPAPAPVHEHRPAESASAPTPIPAQAPAQAPAQVQAPAPAPVPVPEAAPAPSAEPPAPRATVGVAWEEGSVSVWRNINRNWPKAYRTSCLLAVRERVAVDDEGLVLNLDELIELAQQSPDPDTPRGKDIAARFPA